MQRTRNVKYYLAASIALTTFIVYLQVLRNDFVEWDDIAYVIENPYIRSFDPAFFKWAFLDFYAANWHPLTWISHAMDYALWGLNPLGHHLTSILFHAANSFIVVILVIRLIEFTQRTTTKRGPSEYPPERPTLIAAGVTGLLFGLHPVHVESVAWVAERKDLLCAFFFLLSIMLYIKYVSSRASDGMRQKSEGSRKDGPIQKELFLFNKHYLLTLGFFLLALMSKPMAVTLPVVLLVLDWYPCNRMRSFKTFLTLSLEKIPFLVLSFISSLLTILAQKADDTIQTMAFAPLSTRVLVAAKSLVLYLWKILLPLNLIPFYPYPKEASFFSPQYLFSCALVAGITISCLAVSKKHALWLSVWGYYVITLLPVIGIVQVGSQSMADRYMYLPSLGTFLVMGVGAAWISEKARGRIKGGLIVNVISVSIACLVFISLSYATYKQSGIWKNSITLWSYVIEKEPERVPVAYNNRGLAFARAGRFDRAVEDFTAAIALDPSDNLAYHNLGVLYLNTGAIAQSIEYLNKAIAKAPQFADSYNSRGTYYFYTGRYDSALEDFNKAISLKRDCIAAYNNRGSLYLRTGSNGLALEDFHKACELGSEKGCNAADQLTQGQKAE